MVAGPTTTATVTLKTNWLSTATSSDAIQVTFTVSEADSLTGGTIGLRGIAVGGVASGNAQIIEVLANAAKEGDVQAARILVERCVPSMRALDQNINVNDSVRGISDEELLGLMNEFELGTEVN